MSEVETKIESAPIVAQAPVASQEPAAQAETSQETEKDINWRKFREQRELDRKAKEEAIRKAAEKDAEAQALKAAMESLLNKNQPQQYQHLPLILLRTFYQFLWLNKHVPSQAYLSFLLHYMPIFVLPL